MEKKKRSETEVCQSKRHTRQTAGNNIFVQR